MVNAVGEVRFRTPWMQRFFQAAKLARERLKPRTAKRKMPQPSNVTKSDKRKFDVTAVWVFLFFFSVFCLTNSGIDASEANYHYAVAKQFLRTGSLGFDEPQRGIFTIGPDGRCYASHEFGNSLFLIPTAALNFGLGQLSAAANVSADLLQRAEQFVVSFQAGAYTALTLAVMYLILRRYGSSRRDAFLGCCAPAFATFAWNYTRYLYDGVLCGLLLFLSMYLLLLHRNSASLVGVAFAFIFLGLAVVTRLTLVIPTLAAMAFLATTSPVRMKALAVAAAALIPFAAWQLWYNHLRTGNALISPMNSGQYAANTLDGNLWLGLAGQLFSPGKGLFVYAPILLLSVSAFPEFLRRDRAMGIFVIAVASFWLILHAKLRSWYGNWGWGPRYHISILPLLILPAVVSWRTFWARRSPRLLTCLLLVAGFLLAASGIIGNWHYRSELAYQSGRMDDATFVWGLRNQATDMIYGVFQNAAVLLGRAEPQIVPEASAINQFASNRLFVWWYVLPHAGVPVWAVAFGVATLCVVSIWSLRRILSARD